MFGPGEKAPLTGATFTLIYSLDDTKGQCQPCGANYSCIEQSAIYGDPMQAMLKITGNGFPGNWYSFFNSQLPAVNIDQMASLQLNFGVGHAAYLVFHRSEAYYSASSPYGGSSGLQTALYISEQWANQHWPQKIACWEGALPPYTLYQGDSLPNNQFTINVFENNLPKDVATGTLRIDSITIMPATQPPATCFVGTSR